MAHGDKIARLKAVIQELIAEAMGGSPEAERRLEELRRLPPIALSMGRSQQLLVLQVPALALHARIENDRSLQQVCVSDAKSLSLALPLVSIEIVLC
jgi:hypothetical protein